MISCEFLPFVLLVSAEETRCRLSLGVARRLFFLFLEKFLQHPSRLSGLVVPRCDYVGEARECAST